MSGLLLSLHLLIGRLPGYSDHPVVVRSLHRSPDRSAEQLLRQEEVEESLLATAAADGGATAARADWSKMAMVYLGQDRLYTFNQWSGDYSVWQYERKSLTKCDAFSWPPIGTGRFEQLIGVEWVFMGFTRGGQYLSQIVHLNPLTGSVALADCDESSFTADCENTQLACKPLPLQRSVLPGHVPGRVHELVYLGQELLLHYERTRGRYNLLNFSRCSHDAAADHDCALSAPLANGSLASGEYHAYLGFDLVLAYAPRDGGRYSVLRLLRPGSGEAAPPSGAALVEVAAGHLHFERSWSADPARHRFVALREGQLLDYDKEEGHYRVMQLDPLDLADGMVGELRYTLTSGGAGKVPIDETDECSLHTSASSCLMAAQVGGRCGWCQAAATCRRGDVRGPCARGNCQAPPEGCGLWHTPVARVYPDVGGAPRLGRSARGGNATSAATGAGAPVAAAAAGAGAGGWLDMPMSVPPSFIAEGSALHHLAAYALRELQRRGCAGSGAAEGSAGCAVLRDARLARLAAASTLVGYAANASAAAASDAHAFVAAHRGYAADANVSLTPAAATAAAAAGVATVTYTLQLGLCTVDGGGGEDRLQLTVVDTVGEEHTALRLTAATLRVLTERLAGPTERLPLRLDRSELDVCSMPPYACWPAAGSCVAPAIAPPAFDSHEFAYLGYDAVLDSAPVSGALRIWQLERTPSGAAPLLSPPLGAAVWGLPMRRFVFVGFDSWLDYSPGSGSYDLHRCDHERWQRGAPLLCARLCGGSCGTSPSLTGEKQLVYLGHDRLLLFDTPSGQYAVLALRRAAATPLRSRAAAAARLEEVEEVAGAATATPATAVAAAEAGNGVGLGLGAPLATGSVPEWAGRELVYMGDELLLATEPLSGAHSWWLLHGVAAARTANGSGLLRGLVSEGVWESSPNGTRLLSLMEDRLLRTTPSGRGGGGYDYAYLQCVRPPCDAAGAPKGEVTCRTLGAGEVHEGGYPGSGGGGGGGGGVPAALRGVTRGAGPRQQLLLEGGAAYSARLGGPGPEARQLLDYEARTGRVRILSIDLAPLLDGHMPDAATQIGGANSPLAAAAAAAAGGQGNPFDVRGDAASRCDALPQPPLFSSAWPFENHRLTGLGNDTVLDLDPASGDYRVWICRRAEFTAPAAAPAPRAPGAAEPAAGADEPRPAPLPCDAVAVGQWTPLTRFSQLLWLGPLTGGPPGVAPLDALLLWEPSSAQYEVWRIRRTGRRWLPGAVARPLAAGSWEGLLGYSLVFVGGSNTLLALHPTSGQYEARLLDLGALYSSLPAGAAATPGAAMASMAQRVAGVPPPMETGLLASGSLREVHGAAPGLGERCAGLGFHQATSLGDDLLLDLDPSTGEYCVLRLSREQLSQQQPLTAIAAGNLLKRPCEHARCGECTAEPGCGWCSETATCMQGGALAPCGGGCTDHWMQGYCADWPCEHYSTCDDCLNTKLCGWCAGTQSCMAGSDVQPLALSCPAGYAYQYCPISGGAVDPVSMQVGTSSAAA